LVETVSVSDIFTTSRFSSTAGSQSQYGIIDFRSVAKYGIGGHGIYIDCHYTSQGQQWFQYIGQLLSFDTRKPTIVSPKDFFTYQVKLLPQVS
jgi:hypothetical protein